MADLDFDFDHLDPLECPECDEIDDCCNDSCVVRTVVAKCGAIDMETGEITNGNDYSQFCLPMKITDRSFNFDPQVREKPYKNACKPTFINGIERVTFSITSDICQGDLGTAILMSRCPFDFIHIPNAVNFNGDLGIFDQQTFVFWGRAIGSALDWQEPTDDCQSFTREFQIQLKCWKTDFEALIPTEGDLARAA